jgi:hypothetical protein
VRMKRRPAFQEKGWGQTGLVGCHRGGGGERAGRAVHTPDRYLLLASSTVLYLNLFWTSGRYR